MSFSNHQDEEVRQAIIRLCDALCQHERSTSIESILIIRDQRGFVFRAIDGKPVPSTLDDFSDQQLLDQLEIAKG